MTRRSPGAARRRPKRWLPHVTGTVLLDSGAITRVATGAGVAALLLRTLTERGWRLQVPAVVLAECLTGDAGRDANTNRVLRAIGSFSPTDHHHARAAAALRYRTGNPSVVAALIAEAALRVPGAVIVLTSDAGDLAALVGSSSKVRVLAC